jgi:catechol 2,3-dioxygenase-like lactoylglutathione lyase family enzyme
MLHVQNERRTKKTSRRQLATMPGPPIAGAMLRIARPTDNIDALRRFYIDGLGFSVLTEFNKHNGFDGLIVGHDTPNASWHLEFVAKEDHKAGRAPTEDNLLVFYLPEEEVWRAAVQRMERAGFESVKSFNPYWDVVGKTFEDADGYRIVFQSATWDNAHVAKRYRERE